MSGKKSLQILIAEDDPIVCRIVESVLGKMGFHVTIAGDGNEAWDKLKQKKAPDLVILDWMMPGMDGLEVCRKMRALNKSSYSYIIFLTTRDCKEDIAAGLDAGADDYMTKPFNAKELRARVEVGVRIINLQRNLEIRVRELKDALAYVKQLQGLLPICSYCKKIRNDDNYWDKVENYISKHTEARFTHSICPDCYQKFVKSEIKSLKQRKRKSMVKHE